MIYAHTVGTSEGKDTSPPVAVPASAVCRLQLQPYSTEPHKLQLPPHFTELR